MSRCQAGIYRGIVQNVRVRDADVAPRKLTDDQILSLRYQCAVENKDFKAAEALKKVIASFHSREIVSEARQKVEKLFKSKVT